MDDKSIHKACIANGALVAIEAWALISRFCEVGAGMFMFYTQCSNALALVAAIGTLVQLVLHGRSSGHVRLLKYVACCTQTMTFLVVVCILVPMLNMAGQDGWHQMFVESCRMVTHLLGPVLTVVSWLFVDKSPALCDGDTTPSAADARVSLAPTLAYGLVAYACNALRWWDGPYPFLRVWAQPAWLSALWFLVLLGTALGIAHALRAAAARA